MFYVIAFMLGALVCAFLWRYILKALYYCGIAIAVVLAWRIVQIVDNGSLAVGYVRPIFVGAMSALVVCVLCSGYIRHMLIWFYLKDTIERSKQAAAKGKLW